MACAAQGWKETHQRALPKSHSASGRRVSGPWTPPLSLAAQTPHVRESSTSQGVRQSLSGIYDCFACVDANGLLTISPLEMLKLGQCSNVVHRELSLPQLPAQHSAPLQVPVQTPSGGSQVSPQRPVLAYTGIARPTAATVQRERWASIHRSLPQHQTSPSAAGSSGRSRNVRQSGPPRSYGPPVGTVNDFGETTPTLTTASVTVGILPKVVGQRRLQAANLIFHVNVNESGPIFEELNAGFQKHCKDNKIIFVTPAPVYSNDGELVSTPNTMPWILAGPKGRAGNRTWVEDPKSLTAFTFTVAALRASPYNNTPNHLSAGIFIFIACTRNAHCTVGLPDTDTRTPVEEFLAFTRPSETAESEDSDSDVEITAEDYDSGCSSPPMVGGGAGGVPSFMHPFLAGALLLSVMDTAPTSVQPRSFNRDGLIDLTLRCIPGAGVNSLASWQSHMAEVHGMDSDGLNLNAHSVDCAARALITRFAIQIPGFGRGPRAEVLTQAIKILMADQLFWTDCATLKATGLIFLLHYMHVGAPIPASPFLLYTLFNGRQSASQEVSDSLAEHTINSTCPKSTFHIGLLMSQTFALPHNATTSCDASRPACDVSTGALVPTLLDREYQTRLATPELSENHSATRVTEPP
ncbi:hypothetical protein B0H13DRAFT_1854948 [Mycena leptocephala]|nr:hypothetical protein B0H13DRAFT_1854948 [Mycena leptocephala]